jgi:hypothetical protein
MFAVFNLIFLLKSAHKDTMKLLDFKGCVNLFFKITWVATFIQERTHFAKIVAVLDISYFANLMSSSS